MSALGLGASQGGNLGRVTSDEEFAAAVDHAWNAGIRYFDTAPHYGLGLSERRLGAALRHRARSEFTVSTKVGRLLVPSPRTAHESDLPVGGFDVPATHRRVWNFSRDGVLRSLEDSLERTGLDRFDIVYLHDPDDFAQEAVEEALPALAELRDQGVIGAIGAGMNQSAMLTRFVQEADVDVVMCAGRYTLLEQGARDDLLPAALERDVAVVIAGVYNSGLLAHDRPPAEVSYNYATAPEHVLQRARAIADVCESHDVRLPEAALSFVRGHPAVVSTVVGVRDSRQMQDAARRASATIPPALWRDLKAAGLLDEAAPVPAP
ncbi:MAG TPA: aldo/keto reductase [Jiangellaceae bacterium]|nr:aldo/keto reductase [Jiangellaceae bacterium]